MASDVDNPVVDRAVRLAISKDIMVAAAGDLGTADLRQPAALPGVVAVSAVDQAGERSITSNFLAGRSVSAPGVGIPTIRIDAGR
jgi:hypothetical protein